MSHRHCLWYEQPGIEPITEGLAIGNGHLGALVLGGTSRERLVLNESTLFGGGPYEPTNPGALGALPKVRELVFAEQYEAAARLAEEHLMGKPKWQCSYQPLGELQMNFPGHELYSDYRRELHLDRAIVTTKYEAYGITFLREAWVSYADQVLVVRISASKPRSLNFSLSLKSEQRGMHDWQATAERFYQVKRVGMRGRNRDEAHVEGALKFEFCADLRVEEGRVLPGEDLVQIRGATSVVLVAAAATSYRSYCDTSGDPRRDVTKRLEQAASRSYEELYHRHQQDFCPKYSRMHVELGGRDSSSGIPTDARIAEFESTEDPSLCALYVNYARYLLLSCSRETSQPANLQGIWNDKVQPPWGSKCTININTEMNYWPAHPSNLSECARPLIALLEDLTKTGAVTAREHYGARGWVAHHNIDLWRATAPVDGAAWGLWPMGGAWLSLHLWEHYQYTLDRQLLTRIYPILKGATEFFLDTLVQDPHSKYWVTCPSISPENAHPYGVAICAGPTMDIAIIRDLFQAALECATTLQCDAELRDSIQLRMATLPPFQIGASGQLMEWQADWDADAPELHHRHVSHLFALHPSRQIAPHKTPDLARAAERTLEMRGDMATGWSLAWKVNFWARLGKGERAFALLKLLLHPERTYSNLFDAHPPFQIDGNFGAAAGILEMLVQSEPGRLHLLPALPKAWSQGSLRGIRAIRGLTLEFDWRDHAVTRLIVVSLVPQTLELILGEAPPRTVALEAFTEFVLQAG